MLRSRIRWGMGGATATVMPKTTMLAEGLATTVSGKMGAHLAAVEAANLRCGIQRYRVETVTKRNRRAQLKTISNRLASPETHCGRGLPRAIREPPVKTAGGLQIYINVSLGEMQCIHIRMIKLKNELFRREVQRDLGYHPRGHPAEGRSLGWAGCPEAEVRELEVRALEDGRIRRGE